MQKIDIGHIGIAQGTVTLFSDFQNDGPMWSKDGQREVRIPVLFEEAFGTDPIVTVNLSMFDASSGSNIRYEITADGVTPQGFDIVFRTWGDSRIARARATWQAVGAVETGDVWEV